MCVFSMYGNSQQRRGWALRLMKMFWERKPKINMCSVCGENEEKMILFLTNSNQVENVVKVSQAALGKVFFWGDFFFILFKSTVFYKSMRFCDFATDISDMPVLRWQFPLCPDLKTEHPPQFGAYQTAGGMFYYAVPARGRKSSI